MLDAGTAASSAAVPDASSVDTPTPIARPDRLERLLPFVVVIPVLASVISALVQHWMVVSDGATIMVRAGDVLRGNVSTLGMPTSIAEFTGGPTPYHPGPLLFWVLAPFATLFGPTVGAIVGVSAIHAAALSGSVLVARRGGNRTITVGAAIAVLLVAASVFGPGHYYDPYNTPLPATSLFFVYLCTWRLLCSDTRLLPVAIVVGSFCVQVHVSYAVPVAVPLLVAVVALVGPGALRQHRPRPSGRIIGASIGVGLLCWCAPIADALRHGGGNLVRLSHGASGPEGVLGLRGAGWTVLNLFRLPPLQFLPVDDATFRRAVSPLTLAAGLVVAVVVVRVARRTDAAGSALLVAAAAALVGGMVNAALLPDASIEGPQITWFKVIGPFGVLALVGAWSGRRPAAERSPTWKAPVAVGLVVALACLPFPIRNSFDPDSWIFDATASVSRQLRAGLDPDAQYRVRARGGTRVELLQHALIADLDGHGWDVAVTERNRTYYGEHRVARPGPGITDLIVQDAALPAPAPGARRVATFRPDVRRAERARVEAAIGRWAADHPPIVLSPEARNHLAEKLEGRGSLSAADIAAIREDPQRLLDAPPSVLAELYRDYGVDAPGLSAALTEDVRSVLGPTAIDVWSVPSEATRR